MLAKNDVLQERYRIIRQLGQGGMGAVYEARDERLGSSVALKEIIVEMDKISTTGQQELFRRAFEREARLLANLHHEVFPRVMDYFSEENRQFLIMELIHGDDLGALLSKNKTPFMLEKALGWADHLLDALDYLHTQAPPVYHRDIKPQNLKVTARGKIKLLDFGIAKSIDRTASTTTNQTFVGATLEYAPIEQILPAITPTFREFIVLKHGAKATAVLNQNTDARCDIYAVGATFYHLLTGHIPLDSAKRTLEVWEDNKDPLINPSELNSGIPPAIWAWILKALEIERENRFDSAIEMQKALQTAIAQSQSGTSEKTVILPGSQAPANQETEQIFTTQRLMQTENTLEVKQSDIKTDPQIIPKTRAPFTESSLHQPSKPGLAKTEPLEIETVQIRASGNVSNSEPIGISFYKDGRPAEQQPQAVPGSAASAKSGSGTESNLSPPRLLAIVAFILLTTAGILGFVWIFAPPRRMPPISNTGTATTATPLVSPNNSPTFSPSPSGKPAANLSKK